MKSNHLHKPIIGVMVTIIILFSAYRGYLMRKSYLSYQELKEDYAYITKIDFGLFNMKAWRDKALDVFTDQVDKFEVSSKAYDEVEVELRKYLRYVYKNYVANGNLFKKVFDDAENSGKVNKVILNLFRNNIGTHIENLNIPQYIPSMAKQLALELKKNEPRIKDVLQQEIKSMLKTEDRFPQKDPRSAIYEKYGQQDYKSTKQYLKKAIEKRQSNINNKVEFIYVALLGMTLLTIGLYTIIGFDLAITLVSLISVIFLLLGISLPMIDIDARMNSFVFSLFNQELTFEEQSVFYQSKSILQVTQTLFEGKGIDLKIVGIMIAMFSILFPLIKLILSSVFLYSQKIRKSELARGLIFYLGKWSMADVFVVALFMSYIGLYGLVEAQLGNIEQNRGGFAIETINYSSLAPGALFFATYCILSIIVGVIINRHYIKDN
jgi:hypothetical protein